MRLHRSALACLAAVAALTLVAADAAWAQKSFNRGGAGNIGAAGPRAPMRGGGYRGGGYQGGGHRGGGWGVDLPGVLLTIPRMAPPDEVYPDEVYIEEDDGPPQRRMRQRSNNQRTTNTASSANARQVPDEVVIEIPNSATAQQIDALQRRHRLTRIESQTFALTGTTLYRWRIPDRRSVAAVVRTLRNDRLVAAVQPNYLFALQDDAAKSAGDKSAGDAAQYELAKLHLPQAHALAKGDRVLVAVLNSGVDINHPELAGAIAQTFDTLPAPMTPHKHGTAIAGLIAAHGKLTGAAPAANILAIRAFNPTAKGADGTTFNILKGLDWAAANGARVINMSFAGPSDPALHRSLAAAHKKGIVLVAAAGNAGPKSPPLYPAADPNVIAVTATDADDKLFAAANRGRHIAIAAPGTQILVAIPDDKYEVASGTSYSAAEVSGIAALMLERDGDLTPDKLRDILMATAKDLGPKGRDSLFGAGLADAYAALTAEPTPVTAAAPLPVERASTGSR